MKSRNDPSAIWLAAHEISPSAVPRVDYHIHTKWTDGEHSVSAMHDAAIDVGLKHILYSEHARKTSTDWFPEFASEVRQLPQDLCRTYVGVELKVENWDGELDTCPEIVDECDYVMASVHRFPGETAPKSRSSAYNGEEAIDIEYRLSCAALENPIVDVLGHCFGMSYRRFNLVPSERLQRDLVARAAKSNVTFEINSHYHPYPWQLLQWCREEGAMVSLGSNAHSSREIGNVVDVLEGKVR